MRRLLATIYILEYLHGSRGAPYYRSYHANQHNNQRHPGSGSPGRGRHHGAPPQIQIPPHQRINEYEAKEEEQSYFERYGLIPPVPKARQKRPKARRTEAAAAEADTQGAVQDEWIVEADVEGNLFTETSTLGDILQDAKYGEDANTRLRYDLLWGHDGERYYYDKHSYPWEYVWHKNGTKTKTKSNGDASWQEQQQQQQRTGVPIEMNINFHRVFDVDIVNSVMDLVVWFKLVWVDPRLTWNPADYGNLNETRFWIGDGGSGGETTEIWVPDIELWNLETGLQTSLEDTYARVSHDGRVHWGRPGHLRPACKFTGLQFFPFDKLECAMEFGSWTLTSKYMTMELVNGVGYTIGKSLTAGESFTEYSFAKDEPVKVTRHVYRYISAPENDWPVLIYNITVSRSWEPYARGYIATQIVLNVIGFSAFWLPPSCGERMSLSVTAMLAALAAEIVVAANLPAAAEITWFAKFSLLSMAFAFISLLESVLVLYFYYKRSEDMVPAWYTYAKNWYLVRQGKRISKDVKECTSHLVTETTNSAVDALHSATDAIAAHAKESLNKRKSSAADVSEISDEKEGSKRDGLVRRASDSDLQSSVCSPSKQLQFSVEPGHPGETSDSDTPSSVCSNSKQVQFSVEPSQPGETSEGASKRRNRRNSIRTEALKEYENQKESNIVNMLHAAIPRDADDFRDDQELENNLKWKYVAARIDDVARFWIPLAFVVALSIILAQSKQ
mmetsp:Transcript_19495/g.41118  ORF Transcript_19495/g.41118 Transcript_19495/m.41118 type:complete len:730 (+) Transcript_19495:122-2311(+)